MTAGESVVLTLNLRSTCSTAQSLLIDYAVHHIKADGSTSPKVFKGWKLTLKAGQSRTLSKQHSFKPVTTRRYHAGAHAIEVMINGRVAAAARVLLRV